MLCGLFELLQALKAFAIDTLDCPLGYEGFRINLLYDA